MTSANRDSTLDAHSTYLDALMREFHLDSGDRGSHFEPGLNRDRLCGQGRVCLYAGILTHSILCHSCMLVCGGMLVCLYAGILSHSGDHHAHSTRSGKQREIVLY